MLEGAFRLCQACSVATSLLWNVYWRLTDIMEAACSETPFVLAS